MARSKASKQTRGSGNPATPFPWQPIPILRTHPSAHGKREHHACADGLADAGYFAIRVALSSWPAKRMRGQCAFRKHLRIEWSDGSEVPVVVLRCGPAALWPGSRSTNIRGTSPAVGLSLGRVRSDMHTAGTSCFQRRLPNIGALKRRCAMPRHTPPAPCATWFPKRLSTTVPRAPVLCRARLQGKRRGASPDLLRTLPAALAGPLRRSHRHGLGCAFRFALAARSNREQHALALSGGGLWVRRAAIRLSRHRGSLQLPQPPH
uniref:Uncharacterized protein n=1 Tax=Trypanosoma vivax (strain Y486) TaxID=1055687 RepID=G0TUT5_TRYVY|nr:conserved hypothetical protein [Trypanosoma vivax Y486]